MSALPPTPLALIGSRELLVVLAVLAVVLLLAALRNRTRGGRPR